MKYFKFTLSLFTLLLLFNCTSSPDIDNEIPELNLPPSIGVISTVEITEVTMSSAMSGGVISSDGGSPITAKGIVWGTNPNPTIALTTKTSEGSGTDGFTSQLAELQSNKTYYVRAYATNINGTAYGNQVSFKTLIDPNDLPVVTTAPATVITTSTVKTGGTVTNSGVSPVTTKGIVWSLAPEPTLDVNAGFTSNGFGLGNFVSEIANLSPNTTYYVRAYATNSYGTAYGSDEAFTTEALLYSPGNGVTDIDGTTYSSVILNGKEWATKNLNVSKYRNGDVIPQVQDATQWANLTTGAWCYYSYQTSNGTVYGKLYNWYAVNDTRGLAPAGWHVSTNADWSSLIEFLGGAEVAGGLMKEIGTTHWQNPNAGAVNTSGFTALPGGNCLANGSFGSIGTIGYWWSADSYNPTSAWCAGLYHNTKSITRTPTDKKQGFSIRIVKN